MLSAVRDEHGVIQLYDIYLDGQWMGSRRTVEQALAYAAFLEGR